MTRRYHRPAKSSVKNWGIAQRFQAITAGLIGEVRLSEDAWLSVQPMSLQRGATTKIAVSGQEEKLEGPTLSLDYLAIPILVRITSDNGRTYVTGGANPAFLLEAQLQDGSTNEDAASAMSDFGLAADIGFGVMLPIRRAMLTLELRYEQSILNVASSDRQEPDDGLPVRFRSTGFQFLAGLMWPLGGK